MKNEFLSLIKHPLKSFLFLLTKLPSAFFCGIRVVYVDAGQCRVSVPYKWLTQNPFKSTYFACQAMAAEMSTGVLAMGNLYKEPPTSMLITKMTARYYKKATDKVIFTFEDGHQMSNVIREAISTGKPMEFTALSKGVNQKGELVSEFEFTWSFKTK